MLTLPSWLCIVCVLAIQIAMMGLLRLYVRRYRPQAEIPRKLLHIGMGLVTLSFPWIFFSTVPVWILACISLLLLAATRLPNPLQRHLGGVVDGVERPSLGDVYFPISVAVIFQFAHQQPIYYCIPILLLTLADAVAALIGTFYGQLHYENVGGRKSMEGSVAFFTVAFLSTHVPLLLFTNTGRAASLLLGLIIGLLVMFIEAIAWNGLDNLLVPLSSFLLLIGYRTMAVPRLSVLLAGTAGWVAFVFMLRSRSTLNASALLGASLVGYLTWTLGGWVWVMPPLIFYLGYTILWPRHEQLQSRPHDIYAVAANCVPGLCWLAVARSQHRWELFYPYTTFYAINLAFIGVVYYRDVRQKTLDLPRACLCSAQSWAVLFVPFVFIQMLARVEFTRAAFALVVVIMTAIVFNFAIIRRQSYAVAWQPWLLRSLLGSAASCLCLLPLYVLKG